MKGIFLASLLFFFNTFTVAQETATIRVGVDNFYPPYVMQAAHNQLFGFDIALMTHICQTINKKCKFYPMPFSNLLTQVEQGNIDLAVGAITITPERASQVYFSKPYLKSQARFLANKTIDPKSFKLNTLQNYHIGVVKGSIFPQVLTSLGVKKSQLKFYDGLDLMIDELNDHYIDIAIMDNVSAIYWQQLSSGLLVVLGSAFNYGYGIAIAINRNQTNLLIPINAALEGYLKGEEFKKNYDKYLSYFNNK